MEGYILINRLLRCSNKHNGLDVRMTELPLKMIKCVSCVTLFLYYLTLVDLTCWGLHHTRKVSLSNSVSATRVIRTRAQRLLNFYNEQLLGNDGDRNRLLSSLPVTRFNYTTWLHVKDGQRLCGAAVRLRSFMSHLETLRQQLERDAPKSNIRATHPRRRPSSPTLTLARSIRNMQYDLGDLLQLVIDQLVSMNSTGNLETISCTPDGQPLSVTQSVTSSSTSTSSSFSSSSSSTSFSSLWDQHQDGYVILRDLERFLILLARDLILLRAKHRVQMLK